MFVLFNQKLGQYVSFLGVCRFTENLQEAQIYRNPRQTEQYRKRTVRTTAENLRYVKNQDYYQDRIKEWEEQLAFFQGAKVIPVKLEHV